MKKRFRRLKIAAVVAGVFVFLVYLNNASSLADPLPGGPFLVAHRALGQGFEREGLTNKTCTAARMLPPEHEFLENTMASIAAAFDFGAETIEIDIHPTVDGRFAVFHDWTVDCRTDGSGVTREHTLEALQKLDAGYGYTADGGETFPFRGRGVGLIPALEEVLTTFPDRYFILDVKGNDPSEAPKLAERITALDRTGGVGFVGGPRPVDWLHEVLPDVRTVNR
nr:glycerophosphodiester phosphodiesterase [Acidobacteriota bacterium]NIM61921.1 glycerophosphodiester phosphodiesterase [Acidobacteriota bacterium]NIO58230.1 glycerophosphodiester phosphodiesterase [Acidobacteriota bacterium]NIQ29251.1 glycerophosphodiester phosphodiesterase [Acidobacteriota bacterium]NIQ83837.1 glycerophosphodiester phosphodiesterase [Acidobacteriota bacterium]